MSIHDDLFCEACGKPCEPKTNVTGYDHGFGILNETVAVSNCCGAVIYEDEELTREWDAEDWLLEQEEGPVIEPEELWDEMREAS